MIFTRAVSWQTWLHREKLGEGRFPLIVVLAVNHGFHRREVGGEKS